jgi:hypothetical protein
MHGQPVSVEGHTTKRYLTGLDGWFDAKFRLPDTNRYVTCWNGHKMVKCLYNVEQDKWYDWQAKEHKVYMWCNWE